MKEQIRQEIEKIQKRNEKMLRATIPCFTEVDYNRGGNGARGLASCAR